MILPPPPTPSSFAFAPPTSSSAAVLSQCRALWKLGPCQPPLPSLRKGRGRERKLQQGRSGRSDRVRAQLRAGTEVQEAHRVRVQSQSVARSPQGVGEPAACASLFDAGISQSGRAARLPRDRRGGPFPQRGQREERSGAEPALSLGAQRPRRRRRQAGAAAAAAQARGQPSAHPRHPALRRARRSAGAATREWTKQDGRDLSLVLERAVLASAQCHLGRPEEHGGSHLPAGGGPLPRLPRGLLHLHGAAHLREVRRAGAPALLHTRTQRAQSPAPWRTPPRSGSHLPTFVFTVGSPIPRPVWPLGS